MNNFQKQENPGLPPGIGTTADLIQSRSEILTNAAYTQIVIARPAWVQMAVTLGTVYVNPHVQPPSDSQAFPFNSANGSLYLAAPGVWYLKQSSGANVSVKVLDGGNPYAPDAAGISAAASPSNVAQIGGTAQTGLDLTARYIPPTVFASASSLLTAGDAALFAANAARKMLSVANMGTSWAALGVKASAIASINETGVVFFLLPPDSSYTWQQPAQPPPVGAIRVYTSGALSNIYAQEGS